MTQSKSFDPFYPFILWRISKTLSAEGTSGSV